MVLFNKWNKSGLNSLFQIDYLIDCEASRNETGLYHTFFGKYKPYHQFLLKLFLVRYFVFTGVAFTSLE